VHTLQDNGIAAEKVSRMYRPGADISMPLLGVDRDVEVRSRAKGCATLYKWLQDRDIGVVKADPNGKLIEHKVEFRGGGSQTVVYGRHPDTGKDYEWPDGDLFSSNTGRCPC
jgi:hypothetical protein